MVVQRYRIYYILLPAPSVPVFQENEPDMVPSLPVRRFLHTLSHFLRRQPDILPVYLLHTEDKQDFGSDSLRLSSLRFSQQTQSSSFREPSGYEDHGKYDCYSPFQILPPVLLLHETSDRSASSALHAKQKSGLASQSAL